ncbi:MAG: NAD-dependent epimerase/dehydratase family protein [Acidimicrobiales bacterium]
MSGRTLITGGVGFVGTNLASRLLDHDQEVVVLDDLSRSGVHENLRWLEATFPAGQFHVVVGDVRDAATVRETLARVTAVFHFAAQVAVTSSVSEPLNDFSVNLGGTVTLLEELRRLDSPPPLLFTSTNKVYGDLEDLELTKSGEPGGPGQRYAPVAPSARAHGIGEDRPLSFCSPYGCSKGGADQYVLDYAKSFGLPTVTFRMSCIYGPHQCGNEDQGWLAHFLIQAMNGRPITVFGDGCQVRDTLFVDDVLDAMTAAVDRIDQVRGQAFNIGGGPANTTSLLELINMIGALEGGPPQVELAPWRIGDQRWYVSDIRRFGEVTGWAPRVAVPEGVGRLHRWLQGRESRLAMAAEAR